MPRKAKATENKVDTKTISRELSKTEQGLIAKIHERQKREPLKSKSLLPLINDELEGEEKSLLLAKMLEITGSPDYGVQMLLFDQAARTFVERRTPEGELTDETQIKTMDNTLALLNGINPQDEMEGMLAAQMIGVHNIAMDAMRRAMIYDQHSEARDRYSNQAIKLMRTFTAQMEALDKHRRKGQQKVVVEHVHVHEGGQAIVGNVNPGGGG
jgi:hypothetical protein